jgi:hypothetical protein
MNAIDRTIDSLTSTEFDWREDDAIIVREQPAIAVYLNSYGQVTLRRERAWNEEEDCFIPIARENVLTVVRAILLAAGYEHAHLYEQRPGGCCYDIDWPEGPFSRREVAMMAARPDIDWKAVNKDFNEIEAEATEPQPKDRTAAERQRRRRAKQRDGRDNNRDSDRDRVTEEPELRLVAAE